MGPDTKSYPRPRPAPSAVARFEVRRAGRMQFLETAKPTPAPEGGLPLAPEGGLPLAPDAAPAAVEANPSEPYPKRREAARCLVPASAAAHIARPQPPRSADMLNVLVVDSQKSSSFLVKSILLGKRFSVSIATDLVEAHRKADTGLFDLVIFDLPPAQPEEAQFLVDIHRDQPNVPLILLYRGERPQDLPLFEALAKPIRVMEVSEAALRAAKRVLELAAAHRGLGLSVEVQHGDHPLRCRVTTMSEHGMLLEAEEKDFTRLTQFHSFFSEEGPDTLVATVTIREGEMLKLTGRVAFAERTPDQKLRQVALSISGGDEERSRLAEFLKGVA